MVVAWLAFAVLTMITRSVEWLGSFTQASIAVPTFEVRHLVLWYVILGGGLFFGSRYISARRYEKVV